MAINSYDRWNLKQRPPKRLFIWKIAFENHKAPGYPRHLFY